MLRTRTALALTLALAPVSASACAGARGASAQSPVELAIAPIATLPEGGITTTGEHASSGRCSLRLVAARIQKSSPGCFLDEHISENAGVLHYPCSGDGPVEAQFGAQRYTGRLDHGDVELELSTELDWEDGCRWGTQAVIRGRLVDDGAPTHERLSWDYRDQVLIGSDCSGTCTAHTTLQVTDVKGRGAPPMPAIGDDDEDED